MSILTRARTIRGEYPAQFWTIFFGSLINAVGNGLVFPFFSLYFTKQLGYSLTEVGLIFTLYAIVSMLAQVLGGELVDRVGRKPVMVFSLFGGAASNLAFGLATTSDLGNSLAYLLAVTVFAGLTGSVFGPAVNAMVADLIPTEQRTQAYGLLRVVSNLGVAVGPAIGGFIAAQSYLALFGIATLTTAAYGVIVVVFARETKPVLRPAPDAPKAPAASLRSVLADRTFMLFCGLYMLALIPWSQMTTTLPVYLNSNFGVTEQWYGLLMSLNATMVVLFQFPITRFTHRYPRATMMALGVALFGAGMGLYAVAGALPLFFLAQATWTLGEMVAVPVSQAFVADVAPAAMRGRYMGVYGLVWTMAFGIGPLLGGVLIDTYDDRVVWYAGVAVAMLAALGFLALGRRMRRAVVAAGATAK